MPELEAVLQSLAWSMTWPDESVDVVTPALAALSPRGAARRRPRWPFVAVAAVVAVGAGVPVAARYLGGDVDGVRITLSGDVPAGVGGTLQLGRPTSLRPDAPRPPSLDAPGAAFEGRPEGGYTEVWGAGPVLVTSFPGSLDADLIEKRVFEGATVVVTSVGDDVAYWVSAPHGFLYLDAAGRPQEDTLRLSGSALLWTRGDTTYRLEADVSMAEAIRLAESMFDRPD